MALPDPAVPAPQQPPPLGWHALPAEAAAAHLGVGGAAGLSDEEAARRLLEHGPNRLSERPGKPAWLRFAEQLKQPLVLVLIAAGCVTAGLGEWVDASVILGVVLVNAGIGYWQEARAEGALAALAIARQIGIPGQQAMTGRELAALDDAALTAAAHDIDVFARVEPEQKLRLVRALQARGEVVAMTGDGVNDAPALKQADIGIAMGQGGTEVAKEAAAMVLTDDNFASIEAAVEEGRGVWDNLVKFITWTLPTNFGEGLVIVAAIVFGATLPITPLQILWINMTTAVLLGLTLAFEPIERGIMQRPPRRLTTPVLNAALIRRIVLVSLLLLGGAFGLFLRELAQGHTLAEARTVAVNVFVMSQMFYLFNCRSLTRSFWSLGMFSNLWLWGGLGSMAVLQLLLTYWPPLNVAFQTAPIGLAEWGEIFVFAWLCSLIVGVEKRWGAFHVERGG